MYRPFTLKAMAKKKKKKKDGLVVKVMTQNSGELAPIPGSDTNLV